MSLDIKVFWVEDNRRWFSGARECLEESILKEWGMELRAVDAIGDAKREKRAIDAAWVNDAVAGFANYDLALIDFALAGEATGAHFAKELRAKKKHTEVVFYSVDEAHARKELLSRKMNLGLQGIYLVERDTSPAKFVAGCLPIMGGILGNLLDLTRMRGIMVAAMADIEDQLLEKIMAHPDFEFSVSGRNVRQMLAAIKSKQMRRSFLSWDIRLEVAKQLVSKEKFDAFAACAKKIRTHRHDLAHLPESQLEGEREKRQRDFLEIRKETLECRRLLEEAFPTVNQK